jgi:hypothetical protein
VAILYEFAVEAGQIRSPSSGANPVFLATDVQSQQIALLDPNIDWKAVTVAGEGYIDGQCNLFLTALDILEKSGDARQPERVAGATVGIMGLAQAAQTAIGITGIALGLVGSLFDITTSTVLYQLPASAVSSVVQAQRQALRLDESASRPGGPSEEWKGITNQATAAARLSDYIQYCAPVTIEANISKVLSNTRADSNKELVVTATPPAATSSRPAKVEAARPAPAPGAAPGSRSDIGSAGPRTLSEADVNRLVAQRLREHNLTARDQIPAAVTFPAATNGCQTPTECKLPPERIRQYKVALCVEPADEIFTPKTRTAIHDYLLGRGNIKISDPTDVIDDKNKTFLDDTDRVNCSTEGFRSAYEVGRLGRPPDSRNKRFEFYRISLGSLSSPVVLQK